MGRRPTPLRALGAAVAAAALLSSCAAPLSARISSDPSSPAGRPAKVPASVSPTSAAPASTASTASSTSTPSEEPAVVATPPEVSLPSSAPDLVPVLHRIETQDPVAFITIDDGYEKDPAVVALLARRHIPVTAFLAVTALSTHHEYFAGLQRTTGQHVQDHTLTHPRMSALSYERQRNEICGAADQLATWYGTRPWLFRPPYGDYSRTTRRAAKDCGMTALVLWDVSLPHRVLRYAEGSRIRRGDIVLVHWRANLARDLPIAIDAIEAAGLHVAALQDYLPAPS